MNADERQEIAASVAAHAELGPRYEDAVAEGLVERIGEEIDKRVDARLRGAGHPAMSPRPMQPQGMPPQGAPHLMPPQPMPPQLPPASPGPIRRGAGATVAGVVLALGSMGFGLGATGVVASHLRSAPAQVVIILLIWAAITIVNVVHAKFYWPEGIPPRRHHQ